MTYKFEKIPTQAQALAHGKACLQSRDYVGFARIAALRHFSDSGSSQAVLTRVRHDAVQQIAAMPGAPLPAKFPVQQYLEALAGLVSLSPAEKQALSAAEDAYREAVSAAAKQKAEAEAAAAVEAAAEVAEGLLAAEDYAGFAKIVAEHDVFRPEALTQLVKLKAPTPSALAPIQVYLAALSSMIALDAKEQQAFDDAIREFDKAKQKVEVEAARIEFDRVQEDLAQNCFKREDWVGFAKTIVRRQQGIVVAQEILDALTDMGFTINAAKRAAIKVNNLSVDNAVEWCFAHNEYADFNDPIDSVCVVPIDILGSDGWSTAWSVEHRGIRSTALKQLSQLDADSTDELSPVEVYLEALAGLSALSTEEQRAQTDAQQARGRRSITAARAERLAARLALARQDADQYDEIDSYTGDLVQSEPEPEPEPELPSANREAQFAAKAAAAAAAARGGTPARALKVIVLGDSGCANASVCHARAHLVHFPSALHRAC